VGRLGDRQAGARWADAVRRAGRARDESARHARRPEPRFAGDDDGRVARIDGAGHLLALVGARGDRRAAQRPGRRPETAAEERRRRDGDLRARIRRDERLAREHGTNTAAIDQGLAAWRSANPAPRASLVDVANHIDHIRKVAGIEHIGLGSDFDGITTVPVGLEDVSTFPALLAELLRRGYSDDDIRRITGRNLLRVLRGAEAAAKGR
jgi:microsomal dipeptidase-like Zn-dependent dipeptidase